MSNSPAGARSDIRHILEELEKSDGGSPRHEVDHAYLEDTLRDLTLRKQNRESRRLNSLRFENLAKDALERKHTILRAYGKTDRQIVGIYCEGVAELLAEAWLFDIRHESTIAHKDEVQLRAKALKYLLLHFFPFEQLLEIAFEVEPEFRALVLAGFRLRTSDLAESPVGVGQVSDNEIRGEIITSGRVIARRRASDLGWKRDLQTQFHLNDGGNQFGRNNRFWKSSQFWDLVRSILVLLRDILSL